MAEKPSFSQVKKSCPTQPLLVKLPGGRLVPGRPPGPPAAAPAPRASSRDALSSSSSSDDDDDDEAQGSSTSSSSDDDDDEDFASMYDDDDEDDEENLLERPIWEDDENDDEWQEIITTLGLLQVKDDTSMTADPAAPLPLPLTAQLVQHAVDLRNALPPEPAASETRRSPPSGRSYRSLKRESPS